MNGTLWARRSAALYLLAWLMLGFLFAGLIVASTEAGAVASLVFSLPLSVVYASACGFSTYYLCRAYPLGAKRLAAVLTLFLFSAVTASLLWCAAGAALAALWQWIAPQWGMVVVSRPFIAVMFGVGVLLYGMTAVAHYLALEFERARRAETRELELKLLARDAELRMFRMQIDPHFLFNSLNSISALTALDPNGAREMTLKLAGFFRRTLALEAHRRVTLENEVALVEQFLAIEQVRFGPRLAFSHEVTPDAARCLLPPLILQPLVENAVKHGVGQRLDGGMVKISAWRAGSQLRIRTENDVDEEAQPGTGTGIGLFNVQQRLAATYGRDASMHWTREQQHFRVDLVLPAETED